jgi:penicillin-binding protein 2
MPTFRQRLKPRFAALGLIVLLVVGVLAFRLWSMQVLSGHAYASQAENNRVREITIEAPRGRILDRNGVPLVTNRMTMAVTVSPTVKDDEGMLARLSNVLGVSLSDIREKVTSNKLEALKPRTVAIDVPMSAVAYLSEHESEFPGVSVEQQAVREYPQGTLAAHVLGYTGEISESEFKSRPDLVGYQLGDIVGKAGAERQFERVLQGDRGFERIEVDAAGRPKGVIEKGDPIPGRDVVLTIDSKVQKVAEQALATALKDAHAQKFAKARAGAAIALDVKTGEVLAMASLPTYDPTLFIGGISTANWKTLNAKTSEYPLNNRAIMAQYPAASTFKAFTGLAGLTYGVTSPGTTYDCQGRWTAMGEQWPKWCWDRSGHGLETFMEGVRDSCDVVFYNIGYDFYKRDKEELQKFVRRFGFGSLTGIDLPGEADGRVPDAAWKAAFNANYPEYRKWLPGDTVNMAIGQGDLLVTPLQLTAAYGGIGNGGVVETPHVLKEVLGTDGAVTLEQRAKAAFTTKVSKRDLATMTQALVSVTEQGTAKGAFAGFGVTVAGKTGTAQVANKDDYALFVGFAPANDPQYVVSVIIEQGGHGGSVAAPAARSILAALLGQPITHVHATDNSR